MKFDLLFLTSATIFFSTPSFPADEVSKNIIAIQQAKISSMDKEISSMAKEIENLRKREFNSSDGWSKIIISTQSVIGGETFGHGQDVSICKVKSSKGDCSCPEGMLTMTYETQGEAVMKQTESSTIKMLYKTVRGSCFKGLEDFQ